MKEGLQGKYIRDYLQTYMLLPFQSGIDDLYKLKMLENNNTSALLKVDLSVEGGEASCKYFVGGMKSMELVFRTLSIDNARLTAILKSFVAAFEETEELLLDPDDLVLDPECVFINISDYKAGFIYLPGFKKSVSKQAETFFEYMLNRVDYDDKKAVALLYDCYILVMKEERGIAALKERIEKEAPAPTRVLYKEKTVTETEKEPIPLVAKPEPSIKSWFTGMFKKKKEREVGTVVKEPERFFGEDSQDTVLLTVRKQECNPCLIGVNNDEKTIIDKLPFMIGSLSGHTDYMPAGGNVSRLHAEFRKTEGGVALVDLNSTNGTKVNGEYLVPGEEYGLFNNDRISIAENEFIYKTCAITG